MAEERQRRRMACQAIHRRFRLRNQAASSCEVQCGQRVASRGISERQ